MHGHGLVINRNCGYAINLLINNVYSANGINDNGEDVDDDDNGEDVDDNNNDDNDGDDDYQDIYHFIKNKKSNKRVPVQHRLKKQTRVRYSNKRKE